MNPSNNDDNYQIIDIDMLDINYEPILQFDKENIPPFVGNFATTCLPPSTRSSNSKFGRPTVDYRKKFLALERKVCRAQLENSNQALQIENLKKSLECTRTALKEAQQLLKRMKARRAKLTSAFRLEIKSLKTALQQREKERKIPYSKLSPRSQLALRLRVTKDVTANLGNEQHEMCLFIRDICSVGSGDAVYSKLSALLAKPKIASIFKVRFIQPAETKAFKDQTNRTLAFYSRRIAAIGRKKVQKLSRAKKQSPIKIGDGAICISSVEVPTSHKEDVAAREDLRNSFPGGLPVAIVDDTIKTEHAMVETVAAFKSIISFFLVTKTMHTHVYWFWNPELRMADVLRFEPSTYTDGTPLHGGKKQATLTSIRFVNCPYLLQRAEFHFLMFAIKAAETSPDSFKLLRLFSRKLVEVLDAGMTLTFHGYDESYTIPHTTIPLNGTHTVTFGKNNSAGDGKMQLLLNGCLSATQSFFPWWKIHSENLCDPHIQLTEADFLTLAERTALFHEVQTFREAQKVKFLTEMKKLKAQNLLKAEFQKQCATKMKKLLTTDVNNEAARLQTGCVHFSPYDHAEFFSTCSLHMECIIYLHGLDFIVLKCISLTMDHKMCKVFTAQTGFGKSTENSFTELPDITGENTFLDAPIRRVVDILRASKLKAIADYVTRKLTPPPNAALLDFDLLHNSEEFIDINDLEELLTAEPAKKESTNAQKSERRFRLMGEMVKGLALVMPDLAMCMKPMNGQWPSGECESPGEFKTRMVAWTYIHMIRCLSVIYQWWVIKMADDIPAIYFLGETLVLLIHCFSLHKSLNDFFFSRLTPFLIERYATKYQLSEDGWALSVGAYGRTEGAEGANHLFKEHDYKWTDRHEGSFKSLLDQTYEVYLGGMCKFPETCPKLKKNDKLLGQQHRAWLKKFPKTISPSHCPSCGRLCSFSELQLFEHHVQWFQNNGIAMTGLAEYLTTSTPRRGSVPLHFVYSKYLRFDISSSMCPECAFGCQLIFQLNMGTYSQLFKS